MSLPPKAANDSYYTSPAWRTPAEMDAQRWRVMADFMQDVINRLERIEQKLDAQASRRRVARKEPGIEQ